ncbi:hypothetical protein H6M51_12250 [Rhizobium sp. AQ_MP]|uniref:DUF6105 family protein n=1 Tax=Rhizobium sp. AQ_MP TaxID=2761536 RepID=UPI001639EF7A|nr:DUF6105 family protein [Rhizobium sp. AQ_MP]MBC2773637.1 hypothetical protein [Rhizobium sp. AQ_MP]
MKTLLLLWALPITILGAWYGLSYYDMSFGIFMLTRDAHDLVFQVYGDILGIPPETIPPLVLRAIIVDSLILFAIIGFRRRKQIRAWWVARQEKSAELSEARASAESLSSAP